MEPVGHLTNRQNVFNYDLSQAPRYMKCQILTAGGIAMMGHITGDPVRDKDIWAWSPMPVRDKQQEQQRGLTTLPQGFAAGPIKEETNAAQSVTSIYETPQTGRTDCPDGSSDLSPSDLLPQRSDQLPEVQQPPITSTSTGPAFSSRPLPEYLLNAEFDGSSDIAFYRLCESAPEPTTRSGTDE